MWIFTKYGFFSAVCARQGDGRQHQPPDPERLMVRARLRDHLDALKRRFPEHLDGCDIQDSTGTDYRFRLFVPKTAWTQIIAALAAETDYDNFKDAVAEHQGSEGASYEHALHDVWSVMYRLQR